MAMGRQRDRQSEILLSWDELPKSPGHVFYDRLQEVLIEAGFDIFVEGLCKPYYAPVMGAPSLPPGRYFRIHLVGYFEGIDSERGLEWRCADSLSLREFLRLGLREPVPDHSWLCKTRGRLPLEVHQAVFAWVLARLAERDLVRGERIGIDASTMEANAAMRSIRQRDTGETYREMLTRMAEASGIPTPTAAELKQLDRARKGKRVSNAEWVSPSDPEARITRLKDGRTRLAYKAEHAVDLETEAAVAATIHPADQGDTTTIAGTLEAAMRGLDAAGLAPSAKAPTEVVADKGYHSRAVLKDLADGPWRSRIAEPRPKEVQRWHGDLDARRAVYGNRARLRSAVGQEAFKLRAEKVERSFAHSLDRGGMRRIWLRGRENVQKRYFLHVAGYNLGLVMRQLIGAGTPKELAARGAALLWLFAPDVRLLVILIRPPDAGPKPTSSTGCSHVRGQASGQDSASPACAEPSRDGDAPGGRRGPRGDG
jgi:transposase